MRLALNKINELKEARENTKRRNDLSAHTAPTPVGQIMQHFFSAGKTRHVIWVHLVEVEKRRGQPLAPSRG